VQVHPAALTLDLVDVALTVVLAASLEGQQLRVPREHLECCQQVSYRAVRRLRRAEILQVTLNPPPARLGVEVVLVMRRSRTPRRDGLHDARDEVLDR
jgi:hypothetical protein